MLFHTAPPQVHYKYMGTCNVHQPCLAFYVLHGEGGNTTAGDDLAVALHIQLTAPTLMLIYNFKGCFKTVGLPFSMPPCLLCFSSPHSSNRSLPVDTVYQCWECTLFLFHRFYFSRSLLAPIVGYFRFFCSLLPALKAPGPPPIYQPNNTTNSTTSPKYTHQPKCTPE